MTKPRLSAIQDELQGIGCEAAEQQARLRFADRQLKADGSVLTATDLYIQENLIEVLKTWDPTLHILCEEEDARTPPPAGVRVAIIDPIDGTDSFSQGMSTWAISVGIVDPDAGPIAGFVAAPALNLWVIADTDDSVSCNDKPLARPISIDTIDHNTNLCVSSRVHQSLDMTAFPGKVRSFGSAALHLLWPSLYDGVAGAIQEPTAYVWDIAGAMAVARHSGYGCSYLSGAPIDWRRLTVQPRLPDAVLITAPGVQSQLRAMLRWR